MPPLTELIFTGERLTLVLHVPMLGEVSMRLLNPYSAYPGDIEVRVSGSTSVLHGFADRGARCAKTSAFSASVGYLTLSTGKALLLHGLFRVLALDCAGMVREVLALNRSATDDRGFYRPFRIQEWSESFVLLYEGGIARFSEEGSCLWHTELKWDDLLVRSDTRGYWFQNEHVHSGQEWLVRLEDGGVEDMG